MIVLLIISGKKTQHTYLYIYIYIYILVTLLEQQKSYPSLSSSAYFETLPSPFSLSHPNEDR